MLIGLDLQHELRCDQVNPAVKTPDSFFPGFWANTGWGYGVSVVTDGPHRGRWQTQPGS